MSGFLSSGVRVTLLSVHLDDLLTRNFSMTLGPCNHTTEPYRTRDESYIAWENNR